MSSPPPPQGPPSRILGLQVGLTMLMTVVLVGVLIARYFYPLVLSERVEPVDSVQQDARPIDPASTGRIEVLLDPNTATWQELATLPRIGPASAQRIVAYRKEQREAAGRDPDDAGAIVFQQVEDLQAVPGIGPRTVELIRPHLRWTGRPAVPAARQEAGIIPHADDDGGTGTMQPSMTTPRESPVEAFPLDP